MRSGARIAIGIASVLAAAVNFTACGSSSNDSMVGGSAATGAGASMGTAASSSGGTVNLNTGGANGVGNGSGIGQGGIDDRCAADVSMARLVPLDMYIMLDVSSSSPDVTAASTTKWDAVTTALDTFLKDPASADLGVGLQYFPLAKPNAPASCTSNAACNASDSGPCFLNFCWAYPIDSGLLPCQTNNDCGQYGPCTPLANCANDDTFVCRPVGSDCGPDAQGKALGTCTKIAQGTCEHTASCDVANYAAPAEAIAVLPGAAAALTASIDATTPNGQTPTGPALGGAIQQASTWAKAHPDHRVVTVLATDGIPTECIPANVTDEAGAVAAVGTIAAMGVAATPSIDTFVIGVFGQADVAQNAPSYLNDIAKAGGTTSAFIVDTTKDVTTQFLAALDAIRGGKLECAFQIPQPA